MRFLLFLILALSYTCGQSAGIDRESVVRNNSPIWNELKGITTLGNGEFAYNCDATGTQTFAGNTLANWAWHSYPNQTGLSPEQIKRIDIYSHGRLKHYLAPQEKSASALVSWLYDNPHKMNLARLVLVGKNGAEIKEDDIKIISRHYNLWEGKVESVFEYCGKKAKLTVLCNPHNDALSFRIESELLTLAELNFAVVFGYPSHVQMRSHKVIHNFASDFLKDSGHSTSIKKNAEKEISISRVLDDDGAYDVKIEALENLKKTTFKTPPKSFLQEHAILLETSGLNAEFSLRFILKRTTQNASTYGLDRAEKNASEPVLNFSSSADATANYWKSFWKNGGFVDVSSSKDPRANELQRRIILSQFLTAINSSGSMPPAEAGLYLIDDWKGNFHLEMTAWHGAHFIFWNRPQMLAGWVNWYKTIGISSAINEAKLEGWKGAKWLKTPDPYGRWDCWIYGTNRITQNAHPFYFAELFYTLSPNKKTLEDWRDIIFKTSEMMIDFLYWDEAQNRYVLGPPVMSGAEGDDGFETWNVTSELNYWLMSLKIAKKWRERLGLNPDEKLNHVIANISKPTVADGVYIDAESQPKVWNVLPSGRFLRPAWLEVFGCIKGPLIDEKIMSATYERVSENLRKGEWKGNLWGCDYPMLAMTAARLGKPKEALDWLLFDANLNSYAINGYNAEWYLPGNGGLLWAVALMCQKDSQGKLMGFPDDGTWTVRQEDMNSVP